MKAKFTHRLLSDALKLIRKVHRERNCAGRDLTPAEKLLQNLKGRKQRIRLLLQKFPSAWLSGREHGRQRRGGDGGTCHSSSPRGVSGGSAAAGAPGLGVGCVSLFAARSLAPSVGPRPSRALCPAAPASGARRLRPSPHHPSPGRRGEHGRAAANASGALKRTPARRARLRVLTGPPGPPAPLSSPSSPRSRLSRGSPGGGTGRWDWAESSVGRGADRLTLGRGSGRPVGQALTGPGSPGRTAAVSAAAGCCEGRGERGCELASERAGRGVEGSPGGGGGVRAAGRGRGLARPPRAGVCLLSRLVAALVLVRGSPVT
ncbi:uncharacterized protein LOC144578677 [Callithrix jacchus]